MIDEFLVSARGKWGLRPSLVLLLPHAHEGQGPDHASARPERFLQLAADINMRVANCTTAAQYFHLLRRQAALLLVDPLPLIVLTPKSLLRHPLVASTPRELAEGRFRMVIPDEEAAARAADVRRILVCSGKVYVDLVGRGAARGAAPTSPSAVSSSSTRCRCATSVRCSTAIRTRKRSSGSRKSRKTWAPGSSSGRISSRWRAADGASCRPAAQRQPGRGIGGAARAEPAGARQSGVRRPARGPRTRRTRAPDRKPGAMRS